jgi:hypothetical protein
LNLAGLRYRSYGQNIGPEMAPMCREAGYDGVQEGAVGDACRFRLRLLSPSWTILSLSLALVSGRKKEWRLLLCLGGGWKKQEWRFLLCSVRLQAWLQTDAQARARRKLVRKVRYFRFLEEIGEKSSVLSVLDSGDQSNNSRVCLCGGWFRVSQTPFFKVLNLEAE